MSKLDQLKHKLPQEPGILDKETKYFNSAVLVPILEMSDGYHLLFQKRQEGLRQEHDICFPGGKYELESDNSYKITALRETEEEIGVSRKKIDIIGRLDTIVAPMGATVDIFVGLLDIEGLDELDIHDHEVREVFTLSIDGLQTIEPEKYKVRLEIQPERKDEDGNKEIYLPVDELDIPDRYSQPWGGKKYRVYVYKTEKGVIWGITGEIIHNLLEYI